MAGGKHSEEKGWNVEEFPWKTVLLGIVTIVIVLGVLFGGKSAYSLFLSKTTDLSKPKTQNTTKQNLVIEEKMPTNLYGYKVIGEIKIQGKNYSSYILDSGIDYSKKTENTEDSTNNLSEKLNDCLKKGIVKLYGDKLNSKGNFTIIGHNDEKNFAILNQMNVGDNFSIKTVSNVEKKYIITDKYNIEPTDLKVVNPKSEYTEVTLITCKSGSNERLVIKAFEENDYKLKTTVNEQNKEQ